MKNIQSPAHTRAMWHIALGVLMLVAVMILPAFREAANISREAANTLEQKTLSSKGKELIDARLTAPLRDKLQVKVSKSFSRCPSGLYHHQTGSPTQDLPYFFCQMKFYQGCEGVKVCDFRVNLQEDNIEIWDKAARRYRSAEAWLGGQNSNTLTARN